MEGREKDIAGYVMFLPRKETVKMRHWGVRPSQVGECVWRDLLLLNPRKSDSRLL